MRPYEKNYPAHAPIKREHVLPLLEKHPLPWRVEEDWTYEVTDSEDQVVRKCMTAAEAFDWCVVANGEIR